jgi:hypothetical protein
MIKTSFSILVFCLVNVAIQSQSRDDVRWIDQARNIPVGQLEEGLPAEHFDLWLANLVNQREIGYEVHECRDSSPSGHESQERFLCVTAYGKPPHPGGNRWLGVSLAVGLIAPSVKDERAMVTPLPCKFIIAWEGPSDPRMKRPTYLFWKLKDLQEWLHPSSSKT